MDKNEEIIFAKLLKEPKHKVVLTWIQSICAILTVAVSILATILVTNVVNNVNNNEQTQVVIEPRDGDIIVKDGDDYKLLQLIHSDDVIFPTKVQEIQYGPQASKSKRVEINNLNGEDWSNQDSFQYVINSFSINSNKVINLLDNISSIMVYCDFYIEQNIATFIDLGNDAFCFSMREKIEDKDFDITIANKTSDNEYVTREVNNGIEWVKIRVEIVYLIGERHISDTITSDWLPTDADI